MHSMQVKNMLKGYAKHATELGVPKERNSAPDTARNAQHAQQHVSVANQIHRPGRAAVADQRWPAVQHIMADMLQELQCRWYQTGEHCPTHWVKLSASSDSQ